MSDFEHALTEVKPAFGAATETLEQYCMHGMLSCGDAFDHIMHTLKALVKQVCVLSGWLLACLLETSVHWCFYITRTSFTNCSTGHRRPRAVPWHCAPLPSLRIALFHCRE
jgi:hypothetical protein